MESRNQNIYDYLQILYKWRWMIIIVTILSIVFSVVKALITTRIYETSAVLRIEFKTPSIGIMTNMGGFPMVDPIQTQMELVKSRTLMQKVIDEMGLNVKISEFSNMDTIYLDSLVIDGDKVKEATYKFEILENNRFHFYTVEGESNYDIKGNIGDKINLSHMSFIPKPVNYKKKGYALITIRNSIRLADGLKRAIGVSQIKNSELIKLTLKGSNPVKTAQILNTICYMFKVQSIEHDREEAKNARVFIESQLKIAEANLKAIEDSLRLFKETEGLISISEQTSREIDLLSDLQSQKSALEIELMSVEAKIKSLEKYLKGKGYYDDYLKLSEDPDINNNPTILELQKQIIDMEVEKAKLLEQYTENHPDVKSLDQSIEMAKKKMESIIKNSVNSNVSYIGDPVYQSILKDLIMGKIERDYIKEKISSLYSEIKKYEKMLKSLPSKEIKMAELLRKKQLGEKTYNMLMEKLEEARISEAMQIGNIRIVDNAIVPRIPVYPKRRMMVMIITMIGFMVSVAIAFIIEYLDNTIRNPEEVESITGVTVLGSVPYVRSKKRGEKDITLITYHHPKDPTSEVFRNIRTNINFMSIDSPIKVLLVSSPHPGEGKSTVITNLAIVYAQNGNNTLLMDSDMRKPNLHKIFNIAKTDGLSEMLVSEEIGDNLSKYEKDIGIENLKVITAGVSPPNPAELLNSKKMKDIVDYYRGKYDMVLIDSPPVLPVADPRILSSLADAMLLVVRDNKTDISGLKEAFKQLRTTGARIVGCVYNGVNLEHSYGGYRYRYYSTYYYDTNAPVSTMDKILFVVNDFFEKIKRRIRK